MYYDDNIYIFCRGGSRIDGRGVLRVFKIAPREILCATPTFGVISARVRMHARRRAVEL